jgi:hypothetical protein
MELPMNRSLNLCKSTDIKHPIRAAFIKVLQDYDGGISLIKAVRARGYRFSIRAVCLWRKRLHRNPNDPFCCS